MEYKLAPIFLPSLNKSRGIAEVYIANTDSHIEAIAGTLFVLLEMGASGSEDARLAEFLISEIHRTYYQNEKITLREQIGAITIDAILESALSSVNTALATYCEERGFDPASKSLQVLAGVIHGHSLFFSAIGGIKALLITKAPANSLSEFAVHDILKDAGKENLPLDPPSACFTSVLSGSLPVGSYALFSNEALAEYLSKNQLVDIITSLPPLSAAEQIKFNLESVNSFVSFMGLVIKRTSGVERMPEKRLIPIATVSGTSHTSISHLNLTEKATERLLAPSGAMSIRKIIGSLIPGENAISRIKRSVGSISSRTRWQWMKKAARALLSGLLILFAALGFLAAKARNRQAAGKIHEYGLPSQKKIAPIAGRFAWLKPLKNIPVLRKIALAVILVSLVLFTANITILKNRRLARERQDRFSEIDALLGQKLDQVEASMLYKNEDEAKRLLVEARNLIAAIPEGISASGTQTKKERIEKYSAQVRKAVIIENPETVAEIGMLAGQTRPSRLFLLKSSLFAADPASSILYAIDLKEKLASEIPFASNTPPLIFSLPDAQGLIRAIAPGTLYAFDPRSEEQTAYPVEGNAKEGAISAFSIYNARLYALVPSSGQVARYAYRGKSAGYGAPSGWLQETQDFSKAVDMEIDGNVYILFSDGSMKKFLKGKLEAFSLEAPDPPIEKATRLIASETGKFFYLFEENLNRLLVFSRDGRYVSQYELPAGNKPSDAAVDEQNRIIYFIASGTIFKVPASHL